MGAKRDLYKVLGVGRSASQDEIKKAYRGLARKWHPDVNSGDARAEKMFKEVSHAHDVLGDAKRRKLYDDFGEDGLRQGFDPDQARAYQRWTGGGGFEDIFSGFSRGGGGPRGAQHINVDDIFGDLFGGGMGGGPGARGRHRRPGPGRDAESGVDVDLMEVIKGAEKVVRVQPSPQALPERVRVRIPKGVKDGVRLRVPGKGHPSPMGGPPGDLYLKVRVKPHALYKKDGQDLEIELPISVVEAYRGAKVAVPTPDGNITLSLPAGSQSGTRMRIKGRGIPEKGSGERGDLYVKLSIRLPKEKTPETDEAIEALEKAYQGDLRAELKV